MRRKYISPEYVYNKVNGTFNMIEESSFFGSKMLDIKDEVNIDNENIIYYQLPTNEQFNLKTESDLNPIVFNTENYKSLSQKIEIDPYQQQYQLDNNTKWIITISIKDILINYIFSNLKKYRTFEGISNSMSIYNDINSSINEYISKNILSRYDFSKIDFYIQYKDLNENGNLHYINNYDASVINTGNKYNKLETNIDYNMDKLIIKFTQEQPSSKYSFNYCFNLNFKKI